MGSSHTCLPRPCQSCRICPCRMAHGGCSSSLWRSKTGAHHAKMLSPRHPSRPRLLCGSMCKYTASWGQTVAAEAVADGHLRNISLLLVACLQAALRCFPRVPPWPCNMRHVTRASSFHRSNCMCIVLRELCGSFGRATPQCMCRHQHCCSPAPAGPMLARHRWLQRCSTCLTSPCILLGSVRTADSTYSCMATEEQRCGDLARGPN